MNIDERLEALTQSVELLAAMQRDGERRSKEEHAQTEQLFGQVALRLREVTESIDSLARVAGVHQSKG